VIASEGKDKLASSAATIVFNALDRAGYDASVVMDGNPVLGPSSEVWSCKEGFTRNHATGRCCASSFFRDPAGIDKSRYFWQADGCSYSCLDSFRGADCLSCSEFNKDKFKPDNSMWDDSSPSCTTWKCRTGYIRSATGFSCNSLKELENICSSNSRCATCVAQGNCVWCSGRCVPGQSNGTDAGCPFVNQVASPVCRCEARTCSQECLYDSCRHAKVHVGIVLLATGTALSVRLVGGHLHAMWKCTEHMDGWTGISVCKHSAGVAHVHALHFASTCGQPECAAPASCPLWLFASCGVICKSGNAR
jgi:hypothetical protein